MSQNFNNRPKEPPLPNFVFGTGDPQPIDIEHGDRRFVLQNPTTDDIPFDSPKAGAQLHPSFDLTAARAETALRACPFCGGAELILSHEDDPRFAAEGPIHMGVCGNCGTRGPWGKTESEAQKLWNDGVRDRCLQFTAQQMLIAFGKYLEGYRPGDDGWAPEDQMIFDLATDQGRPIVIVRSPDEASGD